MSGLSVLNATCPERGLDGEVVALDAEGRPFFNLLQNYGTVGAPLQFFVFDVVILSGKDVMSEPLVKRWELLDKIGASVPLACVFGADEPKEGGLVSLDCPKHPHVFLASYGSLTRVEFG